MSWPVSPTNGQQVEINGILYEYDATEGVWNRIGYVPTGISIPFLQTPNLVVTESADLGDIGNVTITGGSANYVIITDGAGNLSFVPQALQSAAGNASEIQFNTGGVFAADSNLKYYTANSTLVTSNVEATITATNQPYITTVGTLNGLAVSGNTDTGILNASGNVNAGNADLGNTATANYFTGVLTTAAQPNITSIGELSELSLGGNVIGNILPNSNVLYNLGSSTQRFNQTFLSSNGLVIGSTSLTSNGANLVSNVNVETGAQFVSTVITGTAPFVVSSNTMVTNLNANLLQGLTVSSANTANTIIVRDASRNFAANTITANLIGRAATANTVANAAQPNITSVGTLTSLSVNGNIASGNANLGNLATANFVTGTLTTNAQPNITSVGPLTTLSVVGNANAGNVNTSVVSASGNVTGANVLTGGLISATGNLDSGNVNTGIVSASGNGTFANITTGIISATGNLSAANAILGNVVTANSFVGNLTGNVTGNINLPGSNTHVLFNNDGVFGASPGFFFNSISNAVNVAGNLTTANASLGNLVVANFFQGSGNLLSNINGANVSQVANANYASFANIVTLANTANISNFAGRVTIAAQPNITSVGTLTNLTVTSTLTTSSPVQFNQTWNNASALFTGIRQSITDTNSNVNSLLVDLRVNNTSRFSVLKDGTANAVNLNATFIAGTITTASQPNITSVGNLLSLTVTGNINAPNVYANFFGPLNGNIGSNVPNSAIFTNVTITSTANVTGNLRVGNANLGNLAIANYFSGNGYFLSDVQVPANTQIINGNSNVRIASAGSNVTIASNGNVQFTVSGTGANVLGTFSTAGNITTSANLSVVNNVTSNNITISNIANLSLVNFSNLATFQQTTDILNQKVGATGVVTHNFNTGAVFYHTNVANNFTVNLTNVPTTANRTIVVPIIIEQGVSAYIANEFQIDGLFQNINWLGNVIPVGTANAIDVVGFTLIRTTSNWKVLGQLTTYGG